MNFRESFPQDLIIRAVPRWEIRERKVTAQLYEAQAPFTFVSREYGRIEVPVGFLTDFASVPALTKWLVDDDDPDLLFGSLPHDLLYTTGGDLGDGRRLTRYQADCVLREAMRACGAPAWKVTAVFAAVRLGGGSHWKQS